MTKDEERGKLVATRNRGWKDGYMRRDPADPKDPVYMASYRRGQDARENPDTA